MKRSLADGLSHSDSLTHNEWFDCRKTLDKLLLQWLCLMRVVHRERLADLRRTWLAPEIVFAPDVGPPCAN
ncbi:MAG: hypothetical protein JNM10_05725 [Planctomycetia bacterium]|nr:hypothetical protein [Planctomycetia bacterium]